MTPKEAAIIRRYAAGDKSLKDQALQIHRRYAPILGARGTPEQRFMAEVDTPFPDLTLREKYRRALLDDDQTIAPTVTETIWQRVRKWIVRLVRAEG